MQKLRVAISRPIPESAIRILEEEGIEVRVWPHSDQAPPLSDLVKGAHGLITYGGEAVSQAVLAEASQLRVISVVGVGYDHVDVPAARSKGILISNTPDVLTETTADMTFALLLAAARNVVRGHLFVSSGCWTRNDPNALWGHDVNAATLGIVGFGRIGKAVAQRAAGFRMRILYNDLIRYQAEEQVVGARFVLFEEILAESDFLTLHVPLTSETLRMMGRTEFSRMKRSAFLINMARGPVVDTEALAEALSADRIAGAALDVTDPEPLGSSHPLQSLQNVVLCPHLGSATVQARTRMTEMAAENMVRGLKGEALLSPVP